MEKLGMPAIETPPLTPEEMRRYSRQLLLPEVGEEGQRKLKEARVLVVGAGGLGCPVAMYLAAAGVGRIGLVDSDSVDVSNLQRQVLYAAHDVGRPKAGIAAERLLAMNPCIEVVTYPVRLTSDNALDIFKEYDIIVDSADNFQTRYLVNDACALLGKFDVYASVLRFDGQVTVFDARKGPCYRCLYPAPPPPGLVPTCSEGGVLGVLAGVVGSIQAVETLKRILVQGDSLVGRLLLFDALSMKFRELAIRKDLNCPVCGKHPTVRHLIDYEEFCGVPTAEVVEQMGSEHEITPEELKAKLERNEVRLIDVREPIEYDIAHIEGAELIPLGQLPARVAELDSADELVFHCHTGSRSAQAVNYLKQLGFKKVKNLIGGIEAWSDKVDSTVPKY
ncbi:MAG: molybdopterin-synthase adenylyltransferase MoeB [bacterium]